MYAVIETGGKQYRVELGNEISVDRLDVEPGQTIQLPRVLLVADGESTAVGRPLVEGATVSADVLRQDRGEKIVVFKYKPKARRRVKHGHRAELTVLRISDISFGGRSAAETEQKAARARAREAAVAEKAVAEKAAADQALAAQLATPPAPEAPSAPARATRRQKAAEEAATATDDAPVEASEAHGVAQAVAVDETAPQAPAEAGAADEAVPEVPAEADQAATDTRKED